MASDMVILAVKPYNVEQILEEIGDVLDPDRHIVISAASGVTIAQMRYKVGQDLTLFRAMPNTATLVRSSITCICHDSATGAQSDLVHSLFNHVGRSVEVREDLMEAATVLVHVESPMP